MAGGGVEAGEELVDHDQEPHLSRLFYELLLDPLLELARSMHGLVLGRLEEARQHTAVGIVLMYLFGLSLAGLLTLYVTWRRIVARDDGALSRKRRLGEHFVELAGLVDATGDEHRVAVTGHQAGPSLHVEGDVGGDLRQAVVAGEHFSHRAPLLFQLSLGNVRQASGVGLEPLIHLVR